MYYEILASDGTWYANAKDECEAADVATRIGGTYQRVYC